MTSRPHNCCSLQTKTRKTSRTSRLTRSGAEMQIPIRPPPGALSHSFPTCKCIDVVRYPFVELDNMTRQVNEHCKRRLHRLHLSIFPKHAQRFSKHSWAGDPNVSALRTGSRLGVRSSQPDAYSYRQRPAPRTLRRVYNNNKLARVLLRIFLYMKTAAACPPIHKPTLKRTQSSSPVPPGIGE